jgi:aspartate aminotransferase
METLNMSKELTYLLSDRSISLSDSQTLVMSQRSRDMRAQGIDVINMSIGEPDFNTPEHVKNAAKEAIDNNITHYPPVAGFPELKQAISDKFAKENNLNYKTNEIIVSNGAKHSIANVILSIVNPGDEVIIPIPYWVSYSEIVKIAEGKSVFIPTTIDDDFKITPDQLRNALTENTKAIFINSPSNPTGSIYSHEEMKALADVLADFENVWILSDEIYEHIIFEGEHVSMAEFDNVKERVITINGVSKGYAMTGWRIGYIGAQKCLVDACIKIQGQYTSGPNSIAQKAATAALTGSNETVIKMKDAFAKRRDLIVSLLKEIDGFKVNVPKGAFYVFPDISAYFGKVFGSRVINDANDLCMFILEEAKVAIVPGSAFGEPNCVRFSYAASEEQIIEAVKRVKKALAELK